MYVFQMYFSVPWGRGGVSKSPFLACALIDLLKIQLIIVFNWGNADYVSEKNLKTFLLGLSIVCLFEKYIFVTP